MDCPTNNFIQKNQNSSKYFYQSSYIINNQNNNEFQLANYYISEDKQLQPQFVFFGSDPEFEFQEELKKSKSPKERRDLRIHHEKENKLSNWTLDEIYSLPISKLYGGTIKKKQQQNDNLIDQYQKYLNEAKAKNPAPSILEKKLKGFEILDSEISLPFNKFEYKTNDETVQQHCAKKLEKEIQLKRLYEPSLEFRYEYVFKCVYDKKAVAIEKFMKFMNGQVLPYYLYLESYKDETLLETQQELRHNQDWMKIISEKQSEYFVMKDFESRGKQWRNNPLDPRNLGLDQLQTYENKKK